MVHEGTSWDASVDAAAPVILSHHIPTPATRYTLRVVRGYVVPEVGRKHKQRTPSEGLHSVRSSLEALREIILLEIRPMHRASATVEYISGVPTPRMGVLH